ncbi:MAG TPA: hypothetical protein VFN23_17775 [Ktedonobacteraceae bacterium]|nr:hypothetical protein [Ktedonobacteraceae bacterium]
MIFQEYSKQMPEEEWQRTNLLLVILGIEVPLIGGFWVWNNYPWSNIMFLSVATGAFLLRSWWAMLIVPVVFAVGVALGILLLPFIQGGWPALQAILGSGMVEGMDFLLFLGTPAAIVLTAFGAGLGVGLNRLIKRRREAS